MLNCHQSEKLLVFHVINEYFWMLLVFKLVTKRSIQVTQTESKIIEFQVFAVNNQRSIVLFGGKKP